MKNYNFYFRLIVIGALLLSTINNAEGYIGNKDQVANYTENEVHTIAESNNEIADWLNQTNAVIFEVHLDYHYWHLIYDSQINSSYLQVIVDDTNGEVVSINYQDDGNRWYFYEDPKLKNEARNYFMGLPESATFVDLNFEIYFDYSGTANLVYFNGWRENSDSNMNGMLTFNLTEQGYVFSLSFIVANVQFGDTNYTLNNAKDQAATHQSVVNFLGNYTANEIYVQQWLVNDNFRPNEYDNKFNGLDPGYYFEIRYMNWDYNDDVITSTVTSPTLDSESSEIEIVNGQNNWHEVILSDDTGEIVGEFGTYTNNYSYQEIADIILADPEFVEWLSTLKSARIYIHYNGYGYYFVDIWTNTGYDWAHLVISDTTGETVEKDIQRAIRPTQTDTDILSIALGDPKISSWALNTDNYRVNYHYDFNGQWNLNFFDPIISDSWADIAINDSNGFVFYSESYAGPQPDLSQEEVRDIALSTDLSQFYEDHPDAKISMFLNYEREWWVYVYSPVILEEYVTILISDNNGQIIDEDHNRASSWPDASYESIEAIMLDDNNYQEFFSEYSIQYQTIYYYNNFWYVYLEGIEGEGYRANFEMEISDNTGIVQNSWINEQNQYNSYSPRAEEIQWHIEYQWDAKFVGKQLSTPLSVVIEGYVLPSTITSSVNKENTSPSLDLNGFSLLPSLMAILIMIPIYLKRRK